MTHFRILHSISWIVSSCGDEFLTPSMSKFILLMNKYMGVKELCPCRLQCSVSFINIIPNGMVQWHPFNIMAYIKLWGWVSCSQYVKVHFINAQIYGGQGTVSLKIAMSNLIGMAKYDWNMLQVKMETFLIIRYRQWQHSVSKLTHVCNMLPQIELITALDRNV